MSGTDQYTYELGDKTLSHLITQYISKKMPPQPICALLFSHICGLYVPFLYFHGTYTLLVIFEWRHAWTRDTKTFMIHFSTWPGNIIRVFVQNVNDIQAHDRPHILFMTIRNQLDMLDQLSITSSVPKFQSP